MPASTLQNDEQSKNPTKPKQRRIRKPVFGDRVTISVRLPTSTFDLLQKFCADRQTTMNAFVSGLIEEQLTEILLKHKK